MVEKSKPDREGVTTIEDANIVAYLAMKGFIAIPFVQIPEANGRGARVAWDVQGDVNTEIENYYGDKSIQDFVRMLKDIRNQMYSCKQISNQLKKGERQNESTSK